MGPLPLAQLAGQRNHRKSAISKPASHPVNTHPRCTEHNGTFGLVIAQHIDNGVFAFVVGDIQRTVFDIDMLLLLSRGFYADGIFLIFLGMKARNLLGH